MDRFRRCNVLSFLTRNILIFVSPQEISVRYDIGFSRENTDDPIYPHTVHIIGIPSRTRGYYWQHSYLSQLCVLNTIFSDLLVPKHQIPFLRPKLRFTLTFCDLPVIVSQGLEDYYNRRECVSSEGMWLVRGVFIRNHLLPGVLSATRVC